MYPITSYYILNINATSTKFKFNIFYSFDTKICMVYNIIDI